MIRLFRSRVGNPIRPMLTKLFLFIVLTGLLVSPVAIAQSPPGDAIALDQVSLDASRLRVHFIDIGPGLAMLIETPNDRLHIFVDGGMWGLDGMESYVSHFVANDEPIDVAIVTHADFDHYAGLRRIFNRYDVYEFWYTGYDSDKLAGGWDDLIEQINSEEGCTIYWPLNEWVRAGDVEVLDDAGTPETDDDVTVQYMNVDDDPPNQDPMSGRSFSESQRRNNASLVLKLTYGRVSFLITGDINGRNKEHEDEASDGEIDSEELELWVRHTLRDDFDLKSTVLQVPHHGSNGSCSLPFLQAVDAKWAVVTAGHKHNHPHPGSLRRLKASGIAENHILRTDEGDSTPEVRSTKDPRGDDCYVFETDGKKINRILRVKID